MLNAIVSPSFSPLMAAVRLPAPVAASVVTVLVAARVTGARAITPTSISEQVLFILFELPYGLCFNNAAIIQLFMFSPKRVGLAVIQSSIKPQSNLSKLVQWTISKTRGIDNSACGFSCWIELQVYALQP
jgi:hypothetical protein